MASSTPPLLWSVARVEHGESLGREVASRSLVVLAPEEAEVAAATEKCNGFLHLRSRRVAHGALAHQHHELRRRYSGRHERAQIAASRCFLTEVEGERFRREFVFWILDSPND